MEDTEVVNNASFEDTEAQKFSNFDTNIIQAEEWKEQIQLYESQSGNRARSKQFIKPEYYPFILGTLASMTGMLLGLDMSTISGANLYMPEDLQLNTKQFSLVSSGAALGAIPGAIL